MQLTGLQLIRPTDMAAELQVWWWTGLAVGAAGCLLLGTALAAWAVRRSKKINSGFQVETKR